MKTYCGANCEGCNFNAGCLGCEASCGSPFGGKCIAAEKIKSGGIDSYRGYKEKMRVEINALLNSLGMLEAEALFELVGAFVNMEYILPNGEKAKFLDDKNIYLGTQIVLPDKGICCGVVADEGFILICTYGENGADPAILAYKKRSQIDNCALK